MEARRGEEIVLRGVYSLNCDCPLGASVEEASFIFFCLFVCFAPVQILCLNGSRLLY